mmetsp:Transcript_34165/g.71915  ORF Transcript_34165/g.71915 Transcript_34165/m.71915 type:complete len:264 (+) Transcript_34165:647-1438(+)
MGADGVTNPFPTDRPTLQQITNLDDARFDDGYDSDGNAPFVFDYENDDADCDEDPIKTGTAPPAKPSVPAAPSVSLAVTLTESEINGMRNNQLRHELKLRGQRVSGTKGVMRKRLQESLHLPVAGGGTESVVARDASMNGLPVSAYWELLQPNPEPIAPPVNSDAGLRPPTERDAPVTNKYGYDQTFDRFPFTGTDEKTPYKNNLPKKRSKRAARKLSPTRMQKTFVPKPSVYGGPNKDFLKKHGLHEKSHPMDWLNSILPLR